MVSSRATQTTEQTRPISEAGPLVRLAIPLAGTYLAEFALVFTDMVIVGRLGGHELGATSLSIDVLYSILMVPIGILSMTSAFAAEALGRNDRCEISRIMSSGLGLAIVLSLSGMAIAFFLPGIFALAGHAEAIVHESSNYCSGVWLSVPATLGLVVVRHVLATLGSAGWSAFITLAAIGLNAVLDVVLVFGTPWSPAMGVYGAAIATTIVTWGMFLATIAVLAAAHPSILQVAISGLLQPARIHVLKFLRLGGPVGLTALFEYGGFVVIAVMMGTLGATVLAANQIVFNFAFIISMICYGIGEAGTIRIAEARGSEAVERYGAITRSALLLAGLVVGFMALAMLVGPKSVLAVFIDVHDPRNTEVVAVAQSFLLIAAIFQVFEGLQAVLARLLRGLEETKTAFLVSIVGYWIFGVIGGGVCMAVLDLGGAGIWVSLTTGLACMFVALAVSCQRRMSLCRSAIIAIQPAS